MNNLQIKLISVRGSSLDNVCFEQNVTIYYESTTNREELDVVILSDLILQNEDLKQAFDSSEAIIYKFDANNNVISYDTPDLEEINYLENDKILAMTKSYIITEFGRTFKYYQGGCECLNTYSKTPENTHLWIETAS